MEERKPFYLGVGKGKLYEQEAPIERDRSLMKSYYPKTAGLVQAYVEDACDRLDYEGSFLYDQYPDKGSIERCCREICRKMESGMQAQARENRNLLLEGESLGELTAALFCQEMRERRSRRERCKKFWKEL